MRAKARKAAQVVISKNPKFRAGDLVLTSQMYFDDAYTEEVYAAEPYAEFGSPDTPLAADGIGSAAATEGTLLVTTPTTVDGESGTLALLNLGVDGATG